MINFDKILEKVGVIGTYQIGLFFMLWYSGIPAGLVTMAPVFLAYTPHFRCSVRNRNATEAMILNATTPLKLDGTPKDPCVMYDSDLTGCAADSELSCIKRNGSTIPCGHGYHYDDNIFSNTIVTEFDLVCDRGVLKSISSSCYMAGKLAGSFIFGILADRYGRRPVRIAAACGLLSTMLAMSFTRSIGLYSLCAFLLTALNKGNIISAYVHVMEIIGTRWRAVFGAAFHISFVFGYQLWSIIAYVWRDWHAMQLACFFISAPLAVIVLIAPESPRWLFARGKVEECKRVCRVIGRCNKKPLDDEVWNAAEDSLSMTHVSGWKPTADKTENKKPSLLDIFHSSVLRVLTLKAMFLWSVVTMVYYGIAYNAGNLAGNIFLNNIWGGIFEMCSYALCGLTMDFFGRRFLLALTLIGAGAALTASTIVNEYAEYSQVLTTLGVVFAFVGKAFVSGAFAVVYNFTAELYPTSVRSNAVGLGSTSGRIAGILAPFILGLQDYVTWVPNAVFATVAVAAGLIALTIRDTTGQSMMETIKQAEFFHSGKTEKSTNTGGICCKKFSSKKVPEAIESEFI